MKKYIFTLLFLRSIGWAQLADCQELGCYLEERASIILADKALGFDSTLILSSKEEKVNTYLEKMKQELMAEYKKEGFFPPAQNFILEKGRIEKSTLYNFIQKMPKGGLLHVHSASLLQAKWLVEELTTMPLCHVYWQDEGPFLKGTLHFYEEGQAPEGFFLVKTLRDSLPNFDQTLISLLEIGEKDFTGSNLWKAFEECFTRSHGLISYKPAFMKYYKASMESLIKDNLQYMELRALNAPLYHLNGKQDDPVSVIEAYLDVKREIKEQYPDFDFNLIHTEFRNSPKHKLLDQVEGAYFLRSLFPDFVIGYDLVGEEDIEITALDYIETLMQAKSLEEEYGVTMPYYFHSGESSWPTSNNLYDSVLLRCKRIGHGLNLFRFPYLATKIKEEDICLEVCPVSNQVLGYVPDLRFHPALSYLKNGIPCVLASDDPGIFGYHGMSFDIWEAVMAWDLDLKALKQLFLNSITYSGMNEKQKEKTRAIWEEKWEKFLDEALEL